MRYVNFIEDIKKEGNEIVVVPTDSATFNEKIGGGLSTGNLYILQAPSGVGKTTCMMRLAINCLLNNQKVCYISAGEQDGKEIIERLGCMFCSIDYEIYHFSQKKEFKEQLIKFYEDYGNQLFVYYADDPFSGKPSEMNTALKDCLENGIKFIFLDYLGSAVAPTEDGQYAYLGRLAAKLKNYASEKNLMIFTAMQTNRLLKAELHKKDVDIESLDETFMGDSIIPARKACFCMTLIWDPTVKGFQNLIIFKNRLNGKLGAIVLEVEKITFKWKEVGTLNRNQPDDTK